jgi:dihydroorotate dehydrogenase
MIYQGPQAISEINRGIVEEMNKNKFTSISEFYKV